MDLDKAMELQKGRMVHVNLRLPAEVVEFVGLCQPPTITIKNTTTTQQRCGMSWLSMCAKRKPRTKKKITMLVFIDTVQFYGTFGIWLRHQKRK